MSTRSFEKIASGRKWFWDISWDDGLVEITAGTWESEGQASTMEFTTMNKRDAFIAKAVASAIAEGFQESKGLAPAPPIDNRVAALVATLKASIEAMLRPAWRPIYEVAPADAPGHRIRGAMQLSEGEAWPTCPSCCQPMSPIVELDRTQLPDASLRDESLAQLFLCESWTNEDEASTNCILEGWLARSLARNHGVLQIPPPSLSSQYQTHIMRD